MEKQYRYPGTRPFQEDDRNLFFGRNEDIEKLTELIVLEKMVVLFSKSGYGKSSLLNAGVIPKLKEVENFQTLSIRLNDPERNPVELLGFHLENKIEQSCFLNSKFNIPVELPDDFSAKLWYYAKSIQLSHKVSPELVLIFDQFEELFNYSPTQVKDFASELATLLNPNLIPSVRSLFKQKITDSREYFTKEETELLLEPLHLKVVFSLRSDRISLLNQLKDSIPAVFKKTYELQPLKETPAREALLEPAGKEGDFISPKFSFSLDAQELILNSLIDKEKKSIETFQLQLICQHAEEKIIQKQKDHPNSTQLELTAAELGQPEDIFENHYNTIIGSLPAESQLKARILVEDKLIIGGNRVPLPESVIITEHQISGDLLQTLVNKRLLRSEPNTVGGMSFELSHDTLVAPIQKTARIRRLREAEERAEREQVEKIEIQKRLHAEENLRKKATAAKIRANILSYVSITLLIISGFLAYWSNESKNKAEKATFAANISLITSQQSLLLALEQKSERLKSEIEIAKRSWNIYNLAKADSLTKQMKSKIDSLDKVKYQNDTTITNKKAEIVNIKNQVQGKKIPASK
ncbi:hypothetical protein M3O96_00095 [Aquiflexum sp. TKW24L]|uniref:nSTAND1 domain-containing NTPase n=1 Tax=Aquiflexum sp. TKW24L TaxID=2942212 RepID=UPI0020BE5528|nr:hypothetical protein [Aquiflexum sp. TKW24L]MCL6257469.1 hypothetical protein [Aquiflexum sp. TKW24L]